MKELSPFTYKEAVELILGFYTFTPGVWEFELEKNPMAKRLVEMGYTKKDKEYDDLYVLSEEGEQVLHEYIKNISEGFIAYMKTKGYESSLKDAERWFEEELDLDTEEDAKDIAYYIRKNLRNYGYKVGKAYSNRKGEFYQLEKIWN